MATYAVLLPGDESVWENATPEQQQEEYDRHGQFARLLEERGHRVVGGAELASSRQTRVVRGRLDEVSVTQGPYAETVEQLGGFYLVESDDVDDLAKVCGLLAGSSGVEIRPCVDHSEETAP
ncbi:YciI family protein [Ornithinicoccus halotolerans]|uniref:YciI family protein n=1 Tax=Ornithinicoccus halotolerans TaxID=1748220 RepID=UPI0012972ABA|nr:YciI family protein [Ornithinicoccus halotolerans]